MDYFNYHFIVVLEMVGHFIFKSQLKTYFYLLAFNNQLFVPCILGLLSVLISTCLFSMFDVFLSYDVL